MILLEIAPYVSGFGKNKSRSKTQTKSMERNEDEKSTKFIKNTRECFSYFNPMRIQFDFL